MQYAHRLMVAGAVLVVLGRQAWQPSRPNGPSPGSPIRSHLGRPH